MSTDREMDKDVVHPYNGVSHKKEWNIAICNHMDGLGGIRLSEISQAKKDKYCMYRLYMESKK